MSRQAILASVRRSLAEARLPSPAAATSVPAPEVVDPAAEFRRAVEALGGRVSEPGPQSARDTVLRCVLEAGGARGGMIAWSAAELPIPDLEAALAAAGVERLETQLPAGPGPRAQRLAELERAPVGLTGAVAAAAETGTLVLNSGVGRPRLAWLLPPHHIALVLRSRLHATLEAVLAAHPELCRDAEVAFVSGPSRTADIELTLTRGVHGPKELEVVLLP